MLFNSYEFIFAFLPIAVFGFYILGRRSIWLAFGWLILVSVFFYAWWRPFNVLLIAPSILVNFGLARAMQRLGQAPGWDRQRKTLLVLGIAFNVAFLGYFKYKNFFMGAANDIFGTNLVFTHLVLPLGISFITFQKIAFLIDVHGKRVERFSFRDYCLFVLFFPQLIAGPIVHFREMMPQFARPRIRFDLTDISVGLTLFAFGLFKKVWLADGIAAHVTPIYEQAASGAPLSLFPAWAAAIGFTLQIYFDFSGYTDMALGIGRFFGIRLPPNFDSPLRATSIIDYWLRWHMTLSRFLTAYLYNPMALGLTRRRLARGLPALNARSATFGSFVSLLALPTIVTMLVSGLWHGAGYTFLVWGLLHGIYLCINHAWRFFGSKFWKDRTAYLRVMNPVGFVLTFTAVVGAMVFFRSETMAGALDIVRGMFGVNGIALPAGLLSHFGSVEASLRAWGVGEDSLWSVHEGVQIMAWIVPLLLIVLFCPNTLQILARFEPALGVRPQPADERAGLSWAQWNASILWAAITSVAMAASIQRLSGPSEFLYWQF